MGSKTTSRRAVAATAFDVSFEPSGAQLFIPLGEFRARDGRPAGLSGWRLSADDGRRVVAQLKAQRTKVVIDYEHQTLLTASNGQPAPAAGWVAPEDFEFRDDVGVVAQRVTWTARAREMLTQREYLYFSPVFEFDLATGQVLSLLMGALTNNPGLDGLSAAALCALLPSEKETEVSFIEMLCAALGLPAGTTEASALTAVSALKARADGLQRQLAALNSQQKPPPDSDASTALVRALQEQLAALSGQVVSLSAQVGSNEVSRLVEEAISQGKIVEALRSWAIEMGNKDLATLRAYIAAAPVVTALTKMQTDGAKPGATGGAAGLSAQELEICALTNVSVEAFAAQKAKTEQKGKVI